MRKIKFLIFGLFALLAAVALDSYGQNNNLGKETTNSLTYDEGVVINGIKWATCNVDKPGIFAVKPEDPGMFYQWDRKKAWAITDDIIDWEIICPEKDLTLKWRKSNDPSPTGWRIPTCKEIETLPDSNKVNHEWIIENGINGRKFTDKVSGNSIFLPAMGYRDLKDGSLFGNGWGGCYWSDTLYGTGGAYLLFFNDNLADRRVYYTGRGLCIRAVAE